MATGIFVALVVAVAWAATDAQFEAAAGLNRALAARPPTMTADGDIEGKTFTVDGACGKEGCKASFQFAIAKEGTYPYAAAGGKSVKGVYVRINTTYGAEACDLPCKEIKTLQVWRSTVPADGGGKETADPGSPQRRRRAGWEDENAPSRGWGVDTGDNGVFFGPGGAPGSSDSGSTTEPLVTRDAPGYWDGKISKGKDFITCAVCDNRDTSVGALRAWEAELERHRQAVQEILGTGDTSPGAKRAWEAELERHDRAVRRILGTQKVIACINWGFMIDGAGTVDFDPKPPIGHATPPQQVKDAVERFESLPGSIPGNIDFEGQ